MMPIYLALTKWQNISWRTGTKGKLKAARFTAIRVRVADGPPLVADASFQNLRTTLGVPLVREGLPIGALILARNAVEPFTDRQVDLATTFADQAVIAIENVRLFDEVQARTRELTQSVEELRALGVVSQAVNSTLDLQTVLDTIVAKAAQISGTEAGAIYVLDERKANSSSAQHSG
jgi:GAF domain-containing protein